MGEAAEKALKLLKEAEAQADATGTHGRRDVGTASRELKAWNDRGTEVVAGEAFGDFDPLVFPGLHAPCPQAEQVAARKRVLGVWRLSSLPNLWQMAREAKECARNQARLEEEVESLRSSEEGCEEGWSSCRERLAEELHTQTELRRETSACKQSFEQMLQSCGDEKDTEAYRDQLEGEVTTLRAQQLATQQRYAQLNAALTEAQELRRAENADWKQKHEKLRAELAESQQIRQEAEERAEALKQEAEYLKRKLHGEQQGEHPWWFHQVEDFRKRMREEWLRHAQKQGNPYLKEWLDHARKETEDVADRLREKYEHARRKGQRAAQRAACRFSRRWGFGIGKCREECWGFVGSEELRSRFGSDVFAHNRELVNVENKVIYFELGMTEDGKPQVLNAQPAGRPKRQSEREANSAVISEPAAKKQKLEDAPSSAATDAAAAAEAEAGAGEVEQELPVAVEETVAEEAAEEVPVAMEEGGGGVLTEKPPEGA
ncbi:unnamed protein product [Effrenium voratum]|nr:unnamed protein product [Effrenium voratum]